MLVIGRLYGILIVQVLLLQ